ncbi:MAG: lamin tail domain-containing protein [Chloroflexota bacterium]
MSPAGDGSRRRLCSPPRWMFLLCIVAALWLASCGDRQEPIVLTVPPSPTQITDAAAEPADETRTPTEAEPSPSPTSTSESTATATTTASPTEPEPTDTPTATSTSTPSPTPPETPLPPTPTVPEGSVAIVEVIYDPAEGLDGDGETVYLVNQGEEPVDMKGWTLSDIAGHVFVFPEFVLEPGATVGVHICSGENTGEMLYWERCSAVWNNDGDTAYLHDATGREIHAFSYAP